MPSISLGNLVTVNGKTRSVGSASGLDVQSIVDSLVAVKTTEKTKITDKITLDSDKLSAISEYRTLLANLQSASSFLKNPSGVSNDANNIFQYRRISASSSDGVAPSSYLAASTSAGATLGSYTIDITNLAVAKNNSSIAFTSKTDALATLTGAGGTPKAGTFTLNGESVTIAVGDTLEKIAAKINATTANSDVRADIIKVSDTDFRLKISALKTGTANAYTVAGDTTVFDSVFSGGASTAVAAEDAQITLDGSLTITRSTNTISDAIEGVTFTLYQETPTNTVRVDILSDPESAQAKIETFVQAYNDIKTFIAKQQERDQDGKLVETAVLGEDGLLNNFVSSAAVEFANVVSGVSGVIDSLSDIGINYTDFAGDDENPPIINLLQIDTAKLQTKLDADFDGVRELFEFQLSSDAPDRVAGFSRTNQMTVNAFAIDVDFGLADGSQITLSYTDSNGVAQTVDADYSFGTQSTASSNAIADGIFTATTAAGAFAGLVDGDTFRITLNKADGTTTDNDFVYKAAPVAANEFNSLTTLAAAIEAVSGITAEVNTTTGKLEVTPDAQFDTLTFTNTTATDFKGTLGFSDTRRPTGTISGPAGSALEGLTLIYAPTNPTDTVNVSFTQGVADRLSNLLDAYLDADTGFLDLKVSALNTEKEELATDSVNIQTKIDEYQIKLYNQYSALDAAVSRINSLLLLLDAQDKERQNN